MVGILKCFIRPRRFAENAGEAPIYSSNPINDDNECVSRKGSSFARSVGPEVSDYQKLY